MTPDRRLDPPRKGVTMKRVTPQERFERLVERVPISGCWLWTGSHDRRGYARFMHSGRNRLAHRVSYEIYVGAIPHGKRVLHSCDIPSCVNPSHLRPGTDKDNMQDRLVRKNDFAMRGERNGRAKLTETDVRAIRASNATYIALANKYEVAKNTIYVIKKRRMWPHVED